MNESQEEIKTARSTGKEAASEMLNRVQREAACAYWRANANSETLYAYGYWDGFLCVLAKGAQHEP